MATGGKTTKNNFSPLLTVGKGIELHATVSTYCGYCGKCWGIRLGFYCTLIKVGIRSEKKLEDKSLFRENTLERLITIDERFNERQSGTLVN